MQVRQLGRQAASGVSKIRGVWPAIITDNKDGDGNPGYRVKVKFPWLSEQETTFWARIAVPMAGPGRGTYVLPEIDDQVLVVFEHGDINRPIVVGSLWSKKQEPVERNQSGKNSTKLIKSRSGHRIIFDDREGAEKITIVDGTGKNKIVLDSVGKTVKIESAGDIEVVASGDVVMHSNALEIGTKEKVSGKGKSLLVHSASTFGLKATSGITIGGGNTTINTSNAPACSVSGAGSGELGGPGAEAARDQIADKNHRVTGGGRSSTALAGPAALAARAEPAPAPQRTSATPAIDETPETERIEFVVIDDEDRPVRGLLLKLALADGSRVTNTTDSEGAVVVEDAPAGACTLITGIQGLALDKTLEIVDVNYRRPPPSDPGVEQPAGDDMHLAVVEHHRVRSGETLAGLATAAGMTWQDLAKFNFGTDDPARVNDQLRALIGCRRKTRDGRNYVFDDHDQPGILYIPRPWKGQPLYTSLAHMIHVKRLRFPSRPFVFSM